MVIFSGSFPQHCDSQIHRYCCQWLPLVATSTGRRSAGWANACSSKGINVDFACQPCRGAKEDHFIPSSGTKGEAWLLPISLSPYQAEESRMQAPEPLVLAPEQRLRGWSWQKLSMKEPWEALLWLSLSYEPLFPRSYPVFLSTVQLSTPTTSDQGHPWSYLCLLLTYSTHHLPEETSRNWD